MPIALPPPQLQIDFAFALEQIRAQCLQEALFATVGDLSIAQIDRELARFVPAASLTKLASHGLRGELLFAVPSVIRKNPRLLGYYRLLLGFSQKAFYVSEFGLTGFKAIEDGTLSRTHDKKIEDLSQALINAACTLLDGIGAGRVTNQLLSDLTLLTLGPQLRGGHNVKLGLAGIVRVFDVIKSIVAHAAVKTEPNYIELRNAPGRLVLIQFAPDPDIIIQEEIAPKKFRNIIAIEVKAGADFSNIHNRIGEAEKSHQKARAHGFVECWTVVNVNRIDMQMARQESPSTNRFYRLSQIEQSAGEERDDFVARVLSLTSVAFPPAVRPKKP